jgi:two-component system response regulator FixJ
MPYSDQPVYIIDDEPEMCRSLSLLLATGDIPARSFGSADLFLDMLDYLAPGVIVCDVLMPGTSGIELIGILRRRDRFDPVIVIAGHADIPLAVEAMRAGAVDFLEKPFEPDVIMDAVTSARRQSDTTDRKSDLPHRLSRRERQVLELVIAGATSKEAARQLGISPRTVETYRTKLIEKTGARSTAQLVRLGLEAGLVSTEIPHLAS